MYSITCMFICLDIRALQGRRACSALISKQLLFAFDMIENLFGNRPHGVLAVSKNIFNHVKCKEQLFSIGLSWFRSSAPTQPPPQRYLARTLRHLKQSEMPLYSRSAKWWNLLLFIVMASSCCAWRSVLRKIHGGVKESDTLKSDGAVIQVGLVSRWSVLRKISGGVEDLHTGLIDGAVIQDRFLNPCFLSCRLREAYVFIRRHIADPIVWTK